MFEWQKQIQIIVDEIDKCIKYNHDEVLTLQYLSHKLGYSEFHTTRKFKEITGMQFRDYLRHRKLAFVHTPLKKCSLTADDGASPPLKWCTNSAEMVHGGRRRGARGRHAGNHSGMPLRLRMDSPSIWMV